MVYSITRSFGPVFWWNPNMGQSVHWQTISAMNISSDFPSFHEDSDVTILFAFESGKEYFTQFACMYTLFVWLLYCFNASDII